MTITLSIIWRLKKQIKNNNNIDWNDKDREINSDNWLIIQVKQNDMMLNPENSNTLKDI